MDLTYDWGEERGYERPTEERRGEGVVDGRLGKYNLNLNKKK